MIMSVKLRLHLQVISHNSEQENTAKSPPTSAIKYIDCATKLQFVFPLLKLPKTEEIPKQLSFFPHTTTPYHD